MEDKQKELKEKGFNSKDGVGISYETYKFAEKCDFCITGIFTGILASIGEGISYVRNPINISFSEPEEFGSVDVKARGALLMELIMMIKKDNPSLYISAMTTLSCKGDMSIIINFEKKE